VAEKEAKMDRPKVNLAKINKIRQKKIDIGSKRTPLKVIDHGMDVEFNLTLKGDDSWVGAKTSEMAVDYEGRKILRWIVANDFDAEAIKIIEDQLESV
jgi:hypothetical protein